MHMYVEMWCAEFSRRLSLAVLVVCATVTANFAWSEADTVEEKNIEGTTYVDEWGLALGEQAPELAVKDVHGEEITRESISGEKGLVIFFIRSTSW